MKKFEDNLKNIKPKKLSESEKTQLWASINERITPKQSVIMSSFSFISVSYRYALVAVLVLALTIVGGGSVVMAQADHAKPGDRLFAIDVAQERIRLALADKKEKATLQIQFAEERLEEAKEVLVEQKVIAMAPDAAFVHVTATSTDTTATSTDDTASTTPNDDNSNNDPEPEDVNEAYTVALEHLERTRQRFLDQGNDMAILIIDNIIGELTDLATNHSGIFDNVKIDIDEDDDSVKVAIKASGDDGKTKIKIKQDDDGDTKVSIDTKITDEDGKHDSIISIKHDADGESKVKVKTKSRWDWWKRDRDEDDDEDEDDEDEDDKKKKKKNGKVVICHIPPGNPDDAHTISVGGGAARAHIAHGDTLGECEDDDGDNGDDNGDDDNATTTPDTAAPVISDFDETIGTTTASLHWHTDEDADTMLYWGIDSPLLLSSSTKVTNGGLTKEHTIDLDSLTASTTHYYFVTATDEAGNKATSSERSFTTLSDVIPEPVDETPPVIDELASSGTTATSTKITWSTDEEATSKVIYGTSTPLTLENMIDMVSDGTLVTTHDQDVTGLTASTTYYYFAVSADAEGNAATSSEESFVTN